MVSFDMDFAPLVIMLLALSYHIPQVQFSIDPESVVARCSGLGGYSPGRARNLPFRRCDPDFLLEWTIRLVSEEAVSFALY